MLRVKFERQIGSRFGFYCELYAFRAENLVELRKGCFTIIGFWPATTIRMKVPLFPEPSTPSVSNGHKSPLLLAYRVCGLLQ